jgi:ribonuclease HI
VEYEALLHGLRVAKEIGVKHIMCCRDSNFVAQQVTGTYKAQNEVVAAYKVEVDEMAKSFIGYAIKYI